MTYKDCLEIFNISDILDLPRAVMNVVTSPPEIRDEVYRKLLKTNSYDLSYDWFQEVFEAEMSEGKRKGQHFTPPEIYSLISSLADVDGSIHEPAAGNGGLIIGKWWYDTHRVSPWRYKPSNHKVVAVELSDRSIPLLLLNLSIRGIVGSVYHGNAIENEFKARYILINKDDNPIGFSDVVLDNNFKLKIDY